MKITLFLSAFWLFWASLFTSNDTSRLTGKVTDGSGQALVGATIQVYMARALVKGDRANVEGQFNIEIAPGVYEVEISYTGFTTKRLTDVKVEAGKPTDLQVVLEEGTSLSEVIITGYQPGARREKDEIGSVAYSDSRAKLKKSAPASKGDGATRAVPSKPAVYAPAGEAKPMASPAPERSVEEAVKISGRREAPATTYPIDGIRVSGKVAPAKPVESIIVTDDLPVEPIDKEAPGTIAQPQPRAGLLTAGEWNDLHNWNGHWVDLLNDGEITSYEEMYGFFARQRYTLMLTNDLGFPLADVVVQLKNAGEIIWETRTDNTGKAELWAGLYDKKNYSNLTIEAWVNGKKHEVGKPKAAKDGFNFLKVNAECFAPTNVDIVWAVDATGSMGDEIEYLKTEVLDVIGRAKNNNPALNFRMGTAFYRDKGDEYIVKTSGLSPDINQTVEFIRKQFAGGGGDYPEAVHSALEEVVYGQKWSENAIARICFLVLDASPHQTPEVIASLQKTIREAAKRGIRIVPLAASGIQKDTEFLMKFFGLATNGTYLFLTDHSGIGGKHLEPTSDEYKVEPLNDLLVRVITEYTAIKTCEGKSNIRFEDDPQQQPGQVLQATYYPNPAVDQFTLELPFEVQSVTLYDSEGKGVRKLEKPLAGPNVVRISDLAPGFYTIRIQNNGRMQSGKLMVVR